MATEEDHLELEEETRPEKGKKVVKHDSGAADLEKVTDYVEEAEISAQDMGNAMKAVSDRQTRDNAEKLQKERELSKIKISKEDVELIMNEMEITQFVAERTLREHAGDVVEALVALTN